MTLTLRRLGPRETDHELMWGWVGLLTCVMAVFWLRVVGLPAIPCLFRAISGIPCPTCGATRAALALLHGDLAASVRLNPLAAAGALAATVYVPYALAVATLRLPRVRIAAGQSGARWMRAIALVAIAANWGYLILAGR